MRLRVSALLLGLLLLPALGVFAAGGQDADDDGEVTVTLGYNAFLANSFSDAPAPIDAMRAALAEAHPNITLEYETMSQDLLDQLVIWMTSQDATVDIYGMDEPWVSQFGRAGWAVSLNDQIPDLEDRFAAAGLDTYSYEGDRLGIPFWGSLSGLYYRTDILEEYGFEAPDTVDEMVEIVEAVQAEERDTIGFLWPGARDEDLVMYYSTLLHAFGGSYLNADGTYALDSEASLEAIRFMRETVETGISPPGVQNWNRQEGRQRFINGEGIFLWDNADMVTWLNDPEQSQIVENWDYIPFPAQPDGESVSITGGFAFSANPFSENLDAAIDVLDVIAREAVQKGFALAWGPVQYYEGLYEDPEVQEYNPNVDKLIPLTNVARNRPPSQNYAEFSGILQEELNGMVTGVTEPEAGLESMTSRVNRLGN